MTPNSVVSIVGPTYLPYHVTQDGDKYLITKQISREEHIKYGNPLETLEATMHELANAFAYDLYHKSPKFQDWLLDKDKESITLPAMGSEEHDVLFNWEIKRRDRVITITYSGLCADKDIITIMGTNAPLVKHWFPIVSWTVDPHGEQAPEIWAQQTFSRLYREILSWFLLVRPHAIDTQTKHHYHLKWLLKGPHRTLKVFYHDIEKAYTISTETSVGKYDHMTVDHITSKTRAYISLAKIITIPFSDDVFDYIKVIQKGVHGNFKELILVGDSGEELYLKADTGYWYWELKTKSGCSRWMPFEMSEYTLETFTQITYTLILLLASVII